MSKMDELDIYAGFKVEDLIRLRKADVLYIDQLTKRESELLARIEELEKQASLKNEINRNLANHNSDLTDRISSMGKLLRSFIVRGYPTTKDWLQFEDQILKELKQNEGG